MLAAVLAVALSSAPVANAPSNSGARDGSHPLAAPLRSVHLTGWAAGSPRLRRELIAHMKEAGINGVVIALKEFDGRVFVRGVELAERTGAFRNAIPDLEAAVRDFKTAGIYTIGRIVLFKDNYLPRRRPDLAVKRGDGSLWLNDRGITWVDPYNHEVWDYNLAIASRAAAYFDEIQFDYARFPSDGPTRQCRYSRADHSDKTAGESLIQLLRKARRQLAERGVKFSICVFGMTTSDDSGLGIGQHLPLLAREVDFVAPMMYPSHYSKGQYGLRNPNRAPYQTVRLGIADALKRVGGDAARLHPYFQAFSLGVHYGPAEIRAQILAAARSGVTSFTLWNPKNRYDWAGIPRADLVELAAQAGAKGEPDDSVIADPARDESTDRRRAADAPRRP